MGRPYILGLGILLNAGVTAMVDKEYQGYVISKIDLDSPGCFHEVQALHVDYLSTVHQLYALYIGTKKIF